MINQPNTKDNVLALTLGRAQNNFRLLYGIYSFKKDYIFVSAFFWSNRLYRINDANCFRENPTDANTDTACERENPTDTDTQPIPIPIVKVKMMRKFCQNRLDQSRLNQSRLSHIRSSRQYTFCQMMLIYVISGQM